MPSLKNQARILSAFIFAFLIFAIHLRFYKLPANYFFFFDEGYYLNFNFKLLSLVHAAFPETWSEFVSMFKAYVSVCLGTGKALWFFLADSRVFFGEFYTWYFPKLISATAGCLTIAVLYFFATKLFKSPRAGLLSLVILALMPSHVFYSRLGMQEALSTLFFLLGFYFYFEPKKLHWKTILSSLCLVCAYFTNYRLIILPGLVAAFEFYICFCEKRGFDFKKYLWHTLVFAGAVIFVGSLFNGRNFAVTFSWMFHQKQLSEGSFHLYSLLSYPFYMIKFEGILFFLLFWGNLVFLFKKRDIQAFPFLLVCALMLVFTMTQDKAARYLCVVTPFMALALTHTIMSLLENVQLNNQTKRVMIGGIIGVLVCSLSFKAYQVSRFQSDYGKAVSDILTIDKSAKIISTQPYVMKLFARRPMDVIGPPRNLASLVEMYKLGYRYFVIDPQAYVSYTSDRKKFTPKLRSYLGFLIENIKPVKEYSHFNKSVLERFVFEHNEDLINSKKFLNSNKHKGYGMLRVYELAPFLLKMRQLDVGQR